MQIISFFKSEKFDKFCFYFCLIDLMFMPYFFLITTNYSLPVLILWFIFRFKKVDFKPKLKWILTMTVLILLSTFMTFLVYPRVINGIDIFVYNVKVFLQFVSYFMYYLMFANYVKNNHINIKKILFGLLIFATLLSILYFINKSWFANIKIYWNLSDSFTKAFLAGEKYFQYRYNFIWTDPNNPGYFFVSLFAFLCLNIETNFKEKVFVFICTIIIVISTMSSGAILSLGIVLSILLLDFIIRNRKKLLSLIKKIKLLHIIPLVMIGIVTVFVIQKTDVFTEFLDRISSNSFSARLKIWEQIFKNTNIFRYLLLGTGGTQVVLNDLGLVFPHSGELYLLYSFGLPCMIIFMYCFFKPNILKNYKKYLFIVPIFIGFSINTIVGEQKFFLLYLFLYCYYMYAKKKEVKLPNTYTNPNKDLVSVVVPIYNSEKYLDRCIKSLKNQVYRNIEIILVNDGSTDKSLEICEKYAKKDNRFKVYNNENHGVSYTRNFGIEKASGKYIMFVDSDDYVDKYIIHDMLSLKQQDVDLVISGLVMKDKDNQIISKHLLKDKEYEFNEFIENIDKELDFLCVCGPCCKLYDLDKIKDNNIKFSLNLTMGEDTTFNIDYLSHTSKIVTMSNVYYYYMRENPNSLFTKFYDNFLEINNEVLGNFIKMLEKKGCSKEGISNLERIYFTIVFSSNNMNFKYKKLTTKEKRIADITYMIKLPIIQKVSMEKPRSIGERLKFYLIKKKKIKTLYYLFLINNIIKE